MADEKKPEPVKPAKKPTLEQRIEFLERAVAKVGKTPYDELVKHLR